MSDLARWKLQGPVHTLRVEFAEWDLSREEWKAPGRFSRTRFLPNGKTTAVEGWNPDGSTYRSIYSYDETGRLNETRWLPGNGPASRTLYSYDEVHRLSCVSSLNEHGSECKS